MTIDHRPGIRRDVECALVFNFLVPSVVALQIAPAAPTDASRSEQLMVIRGDGSEQVPVVETAGPHRGRVHIIEAPAGPVTLSYRAVTSPSVDSAGSDASISGAPMTGQSTEPSPYADEVLTALRQSRYCPSDLLVSFAMAELGAWVGTERIAAAASSWVFERIAYVSGSSGPTDTAVDTLLSGRGVCRDFAHLTATLCRALGVPARLVSVYAPGLVQMDFHVVVEAWRAGRWHVLDPTRLAPRSSLVRIATGRDAADTSFAATIRGDVEMVSTEVSAVVDGDLPADDHESVFMLGYG